MFYTKLEAVDFDPFIGDPIEKVVPSTEPQKEIWVSCMIGGDEANLAYNESISLNLNGLINEQILKEALAILIARNESLRSAFSSDGSQMIVYQSQPLQLHQADITSFDKKEQQHIIDEYHCQDALRVFNITDGSLIRFALFKKSQSNYLLTINKHHIISDGWSSGIILEELSGIYNAKINNQALPKQPLQFSHYAEAAYRFSKDPAYSQIEDYWINEYKDDVPVFEIPPDYPRPPLRTHKATRLDFLLDKTFANSIKKAGAKFGCSFVTMVMAAFEVLLYKYSGNKDVVIGLPTAGQSAAEMYDLVGHCVNILPLRSRPQNELQFSEYLKLRKSKTLRDYENQRFTFGSLLKKLNIPRDASRIPLIPVAFNIDIGMNKKVAFDSIEYDIIYNVREYETFEVFLNIAETSEGFDFQWSYNTQLYKPETISGLMDKFTFLLRQIVDNPEVPIAELQLQDNSTALKNIAQWNSTFKKLPDTNTITMFEDIVTKYPNNIALKFNNEEISYAQLNILANRLANYLSQQGLKKGDRVAVLLDRGTGIIISLLAILKCGAAYLPVDPEFPVERVKFILDDANAAYSISNSQYINKFEGINRPVDLNSLESELNLQPESFNKPEINQNDVAYIIYTSGSTGKPKGVMVTHRNLLNLLTGATSMLGIHEHTRVLSLTTVSFDIATAEIFMPLISGGTLVLTNIETTINGEAILNIIKKEKINYVQATPVTYKIMLDAGWDHQLNITAVSTGEALPKALADKIINKVNALYNLYGPTETTIWSTGTQVNKEDEIILIGKPIQNTQVYILDEHKNVLPVGQVGEIYIGGDGVTAGYHNREALTAEKFVANPFSENSKLYKTGDLGKYQNDGNIICLGRSDNQAKIRGYRVELEEIETYVNKLPGVKEAVVVVTGDNAADYKLAAFIITQQATNKNEFSKQEILDWRKNLKEFLPDYMIPVTWHKISSFPLTPNKKIDRKALWPSLAANQEHQQFIDESAFDNIKQAIKEIWEQEIGINGIEPHDDFFELGGHSMVAVNVMGKIHKTTGIKLPIAALFEYPTIESLAKKIASDPSQTNKILIPLRTEGNKIPIFLIHAGGLNILSYKPLSRFLDPDQPLYGIQGLRDDKDLDHLKDIVSISTRYLSEVEQVYPDGPYIIMGYSYGGIIAFEMAKQLLHKGKKVLFVGILDTYVNDSWYIESKWVHVSKKITRQLHKISFFFQNLVKYPKDTIEYQRHVINKRLNRYKVAPENQVYDFPMHIVNAYNSAYKNYSITPINVKIHLFRVSKRIYYIDDRKTLGWKKYALNGLEINPVPGDHRTFMLHPHNEKLGRTIQDVVNKAVNES